jgi:hypothetical protein
VISGQLSVACDDAPSFSFKDSISILPKSGCGRLSEKWFSRKAGGKQKRKMRLIVSAGYRYDGPIVP